MRPAYSGLSRHHNLHEPKRFVVFCIPYFVVACIAVAVLSTVAWSVFLAELDKDHDSTEASAFRTTRAVSEAYAGHLYRMLESVDQLTMHVRHGWQAGQSNYRLNQDGAVNIFPTRSGFDATILDRDGNVVTSTISNIEGPSAKGEPFFLAHKQDAGDFLYIGPPREGIFKKATVVQFSRKLNTGEQSFSGIVLVSVIPDYFIAGFGEGVLGQKGLLAILDSDMVTRITRVGADVQPPDAPAIRARVPLPELSGTQIVRGEDIFVDKRTRYVSWHPTDNYSMVVLAGLDQEEVLAPFLAYRATALRNGQMLTLVVLAAALLSALAVSRLAWRKTQVDALQMTYRTATESGADGFIIARPLLMNDGTPADFLVLDCNQKAAELLGRNRKDLLGQSVTNAYKGSALSRIIEVFRHATKSGFHEGELEIEDCSRGGSKWLELKIARPDGDLAITVRDITHHKMHLKELERLGSEDALTGLLNRHWLNQNLPLAVMRARKNQQRLSLLFIDLDGFKAVNDTLGHEAGDELLRTAGKRLKEAVRPQDSVVRIGGDEFVILLENVQSTADSAQVAERILYAFQQPFRLQKGIRSIATSIGISLFPDDADAADVLIQNADMAMYAVKTSGKNDYRFFDAGFAQEVQSKHQRELELKHALQHGEIGIHFQPRVSLQTGETCSMEALARWHHPSRGLVQPDEFIPLAEETGLIVQVGEIVLQQVCAQLATWTRAGQKVVPVSINIAARHFKDADVVALIEAALERYDLCPGLLEVEITESTMMSNLENVYAALDKLQKLGVTLLVDDFGTGYSSLSLLQELDFDVLKVDMAFTRQLGQKESGVTLFSTIIAMAHSLGMKVVAEGVETQEQARRLRDMKCDEIQGFLISPAVQAEACEPFVSKVFHLH
ncbi:bifunctional diguanylate cyclase/phosphodiesterase [Noviherbaspirillum aridicola]|uniref:PAS domain S-box-containing protein/diguanylate cyclase (GGDEF)-like protein n=1 Tax=Noviherbaspirillum aridicola TaxID=2849687 RepID=A0ABQ4Q928_9BURK|nr:EAL domain-containing protein [Noviherbaspirillum aridicola]GIZ53708.1 hypothetical protein NCCP691_37220 [Noviherbaspirillum aridicola]